MFIHNQKIIYQPKLYREPLQPLLCLFILYNFVVVLDAMSESTLDKLSREAKEKELERKVKNVRREQIERERMQ